MTAEVTGSTDFDLLQVRTLNSLFSFRSVQSVSHFIHISWPHAGFADNVKPILQIQRIMACVSGCHNSSLSIWRKNCMFMDVGALYGQATPVHLTGTRESAQTHKLRTHSSASLYHLTHCLWDSTLQAFPPVTIALPTWIVTYYLTVNFYVRQWCNTHEVCNCLIQVQKKISTEIHKTQSHRP